MRLTNSMRDSILEQECRNKFHDKQAVAEKELIDLLDKHVASISPDIPEDMVDYVNTTNDIKIVNYKDTSLNQYYGIYNYYPKHKHHYEINVTATKKMIKLGDKVKKLRDSEKEFRRSLRRVLNSFTTDKQLLANVPELAKYFTNQDRAKNMAVIPQELINQVRKELKK